MASWSKDFSFREDQLVIWSSLIGLVFIFVGEKVFLKYGQNTLTEKS